MCLLFILIVIGILYLYMIFPRISRRHDMSCYHHVSFAHRGYHCAEKGIPENSMKAFRAALARGYGIEIDLHLTRDGRLAVFHDHTLQRMCGRPGIIEELTYEELKSCRLSGTAETIPLFTEILSLVKGRVPLLIELKIPDSPDQICEETLRLLKDYNGAYLIQSFNTMGLLWFRRHAPQVLRGQLSSNLIRDDEQHSFFLRFAVRYLLSDVLGRPDFISYNMKDLPVTSVWILQHVFRTPIAVWTLRSADELKQGRLHYDMLIFEDR